MILEAFRKASKIISTMKGYISHELQRCMEAEGNYLLLVRWETLEDHTVGLDNHTNIKNGKINSIIFMTHSRQLNTFKKLIFRKSFTLQKVGVS